MARCGKSETICAAAKSEQDRMANLEQVAMFERSSECWSRGRQAEGGGEAMSESDAWL